MLINFKKLLTKNICQEVCIFLLFLLFLLEDYGFFYSIRIAATS